MLLFLFLVLFLLRQAQRALFLLLFHEPPRSARTPRPAPAIQRQNCRDCRIYCGRSDMACF